jgi:predicted transcriptional regulator of viral defense system
VNYNTISSLSQKEAEIVARLSYEKKEIVTAETLDRYLPTNFQYRKQLVYRLTKKNILLPIKRGVYIFIPLEAVRTGRRVNDFLIPPIFFPNGNYYIGYSTMFNYYHFTEQQFQTVFVINTTLCKEREVAGLLFKFVKVSPERMYGTQKIKIKTEEVIISSKERTLIDLLYFNKPVGGIDAAISILELVLQEASCDVRKLIEYVTRFPNIKTRKYFGLVLERNGISDKALKPLLKSVQNTALISFSDSRKGTINQRWRVILNDSPR